MSEKLYPDFLKEAQNISAQIVAWRRFYHQHPELSFQEKETSRSIASQLSQLGFQNVHIGTANQAVGVIADLSNASGSCVALRADIDALPIHEETGLPFASMNPGVMHACGHDTHIAMLLGAAAILVKFRSQLRGTIRFIFQPAEESSEYIGVFGAPAMERDGVLNGVDAIFGFHIWQYLPSGVLGYREGPMMACSDRWKLHIQGRGGHGAAPHLTCDPTIAAAHFIEAAQTFVSREMNPLKAAVFSVGTMQAGSAFNIVPDSVDLTGTARAFEPEVRSALENSIGRIARDICAAFRCTAEFTYLRGIPPTVCNPEMARLGAASATKIYPVDRVQTAPQVMGAEDFSVFLQKKPGAYFVIGCASEAAGSIYPHHNPRFVIDEKTLAPGAAFEAQLAWDFLHR